MLWSAQSFGIPERIIVLGACGILLLPLFESVLSNSSVDGGGKEGRQISLLFTGDVLLDRTVRTVAETRGYGFLIAPLLPVFLEHDVVVVNLEGPVTTYPSVSQDAKIGTPENTRFTFGVDAADFLAAHGITAHLGNNHSGDFGPEGILQTESNLNAAGVAFFGDTGGFTENALTLDVGGNRIGLVSYNQFSYGSLERAIATLIELRPHVDVLIVYTHWGLEYESTPSRTQEATAKAFAAAGTDLIVGSHPHVLQPQKREGSTLIYYSLGNFIFDQYWEDAVRCGGMLSIGIEDGQIISHELIPVWLHESRQTRLSNCIVPESLGPPS